MTAAVQQTSSSAAQSLFAGNASGTEQVSQDRFLKMLVAQLQNQDPLNPMDNAQMTSQMAQISTVDGIERLNATLQALVAGSTENQAMQAAALVGRGVLVPGSGFGLTQGMAIGGVELAGPADRVTVTIKDGSGLVVKTLELGAQEAGSQAFTWDGVADSGAAAADGNYTISVRAVRGAETVEASALELGIVSSVVRTSQGVSLNVGALGTFKMSDVREIL